MDVSQVLHMNGGVGDTSYANNSSLQKEVISMNKPILEEAITNFLRSTFNSSSNCLIIADLGCSSGSNTFFVVSQLIKHVQKVCTKLEQLQPLEYQVLLNDLPGNDFNSIFKSLPSFKEYLGNQIGATDCFFAGVPGSFYGRLFPKNSLHFIHSSYSLMWLSQVPQGLKNNKRNIYMSSSSPPCVSKAYKEQYQRDFSLFLKCRSEELVAGGCMVLTILGRKSEDPSSKECCYIWELLAIALNDMVSEGFIEEEKLHSFNIPQYTPSPSEVKQEFIKNGGFTINHLETFPVKWNACHKSVESNKSINIQSIDEEGYSVTQCMRAVAEPLIVAHFGEAIIDQVFFRFKKIIADRMSKEQTEFINVTLSVTKKSLGD